MPFSILPNMTRRYWLKSGLVASGAALISNRDVLALTQHDAGPDWIAFVSDTHIAANPETIARENNMTNNLKQVVREILQEQNLPKAVLIDGDLALGDGQKGDYLNLLYLLKPLIQAEIPIHLALGNHDNRDHFREVLSDSALLSSIKATTVESHHTTDVTICGIRFIVLDSLQRPNYTPGAIGESQRSWLKAALNLQPDTPTIIFVHHDPSLELKRSLEDTPELYDIIVPQRHVKALVFGHTHVWNPTTQHEGIRLINIPAVAYNFTPIQPQGWSKFVPLQGGATLTLNTLDKKHSAHKTPVLLNWR